MQCKEQKKFALLQLLRTLSFSILILALTSACSPEQEQETLEVSLSLYEKELLPQRTAQRPKHHGCVLDETTVVNVFYVDCKALNTEEVNPGTLERPFQSISQAVNFVQEYKIPAKIIIKPGIYRECIGLKGGRASKDDPLLIIEAEEKGTVILSGSDPLSGWTKENRGYSAPWSYKWGLSQLEYEETLQYAELSRRKSWLS